MARYSSNFILKKQPKVIAGSASNTLKAVALCQDGDNTTFATSILFQNTDESHDILFNFDGGSSFFTLKAANPPITCTGQLFQIYLKCGTNHTPGYEILCNYDR